MLPPAPYLDGARPLRDYPHTPACSPTTVADGPPLRWPVGVWLWGVACSSSPLGHAPPQPFSACLPSVPTKPRPPCPQCRRLHCDHPRTTYNPAPNTRATKQRAQAVQAWRNQYGDLCPGFGVDPHPSTDLTADHPTPLKLGGLEHQPLRVLCRACNARKGGG